MNTPIELEYPLPVRHPAARDFPDVTRKALDAWLDALPMGNPEPAAARIMDLLYQANRTLLPDEHRLYLVQQVGEKAGDLLNMLHRRLRDVAAPPNRKEMELAELVMLLHGESALAYRTAMDCKFGRKLFQRKSGLSLSTALQRATHHLCQNMKVHYLINVPPTELLWRHLYALFRFAQDKELLAETAQPLPSGRTDNVETLFKTTVLFHLSGPQSLRGDEMIMLSDLLPDLAPKAELLSAREDSDRPLTALLGMQSGTPPQLDFTSSCASCSNGSDCMRLDLSPFVRSVRRRLAKIRKTATEGGMTHVTEQRVLEQLKSRFGGKQKRHANRICEQQGVEVIAGLQHAYAWLTDPRIFEAPEAAPSPADNAKAEPRSSGIEYNVVLNLEQVTIEAPAYFNSDSDSNPESRGLGALRRALCRTLNFSAGGYCLSADDTDGFQLRVGELLILRENDADRWLPAAVTWVDSDGHHVQFGTKLLAPHVLPGKALCHENKETNSAECLLLFGSNGSKPDSIILGPRCLPEGTNVSVDFGNHSLEIVLMGELNRTQGYVEYACDNSRELDLAPETVPLSRSPDARAEGSQISGQEFEDLDRPWRRFLW